VKSHAETEEKRKSEQKRQRLLMAAQVAAAVVLPVLATLARNAWIRMRVRSQARHAHSWGCGKPLWRGEQPRRLGSLWQPTGIRAPATLYLRAGCLGIPPWLLPRWWLYLSREVEVAGETRRLSSRPLRMRIGWFSS